MLSELYLKVVALDTAASGQKALAYTKQFDVSELRRCLVGLRLYSLISTY
jgi:hypothetical protein